ncbi:MAG TPA: hypothetical protein VG675_09445 [Bryobacteraceae bacterium]|nr:hypothetical protein [Bryobacteraceae bacterium]
MDIGIPTEANEAHYIPASVRSAVTQAFRAGVDGVVLSGKYSDMKLANLAGVEAAARELGLA